MERRFISFVRSPIPCSASNSPHRCLDSKHPLICFYERVSLLIPLFRIARIDTGNFALIASRFASEKGIWKKRQLARNLDRNDRGQVSKVSLLAWLSCCESQAGARKDERRKRNKKNERERMKRWCEEKGFPSIFRFENSIVLPLSLSLFSKRRIYGTVLHPLPSRDGINRDDEARHEVESYR